MHKYLNGKVSELCYLFPLAYSLVSHLPPLEYYDVCTGVCDEARTSVTM